MSQILSWRFNATSARKTTRSLIKATRAVHAHQMLGAVIVVAHASDIVRVVSHISLWHLVAAIVVFGLWLASQEHESASEIA